MKKEEIFFFFFVLSKKIDLDKRLFLCYTMYVQDKKTNNLVPKTQININTFYATQTVGG